MNTYSLEQISRTGNLDINLILRQYKLDLMCKFMDIKSNNPKLTQKQIAKQIGSSDSNLSRYRKDINTTSPYKSYNTRKNVTDCQNTSIYLTNCQEEVSKNVTDRHKSKTNLKGGALLEIGNLGENKNFITIVRNMVDNV